MIILLAALATIETASPALKVVREVKARATIIRGSEISPRTWKPGSEPTQREIIRTEKEGRPTLIRVTEFE